MASERRERIRNYIADKGEVRLQDLMNIVDGCSNMTLWRDLRYLENEGHIKRTRGGAIAMHSDREGYYTMRENENIDAKQLIARAACSFVRPGSSIYFDSGSTVMSVAKCLPEAHYTIVTSGANTAVELSRRSGSNVLLVGGQMSSNTFSVSGAQSEAFLENLNIDVALMATSGFSLSGGFSSGNFNECRLKTLVIKKASKTVLLMDNAKIGRILPFTFAHVSDIDVLILSSTPDQQILDLLVSHGIEVIIAQ